MCSFSMVDLRGFVFMAKGRGEVLMQNCQKYSKEERLYHAVTESSVR